MRVPISASHSTSPMQFVRSLEFGAQVFDFERARRKFLTGHIYPPLLRLFLGFAAPARTVGLLRRASCAICEAIRIDGAQLASVGVGHDHFSSIALDSMRRTVSRAVRRARKLAPVVTRGSSSPSAIGSNSTASSTRSSVILSRNQRVHVAINPARAVCIASTV